MTRTSELIEQILKSPEGRQILGYVSPIYDESYIGLWLFEIIGRELDEMKEWAMTFADQVVPQTATWALQYYEKEYNIPSDETISITQRRSNVLLKIKTRAPMNPDKLAYLVQLATGVNVRIDECISKNKFAVIVSAIPDKKLDKLVAQTVDPAKPAHLIYSISYERQTEAKMYTGGIFTMAKFFEMKQVR